jgi:hypothetical protein
MKGSIKIGLKHLSCVKGTIHFLQEDKGEAFAQTVVAFVRQNAE